MSKSDPFGFERAAIEGSSELDISVFEPRPRPVDRPAVEASREVARDSGFTRRPGPVGSERPVSVHTALVTPPKGRKRRVSMAELLGIEDRYPDTERAQLNMLAPVPIALRWRAIVQARQVPAWEILEAAMNALEATNAESRPETGTA